MEIGGGVGVGRGEGLAIIAFLGFYDRYALSIIRTSTTSTPSTPSTALSRYDVFVAIALSQMYIYIDRV